MKNYDPREYTITIRFERIEDDSFFVARVSELPDVEDYGDSHDEAYLLAIETIAMAMSMAKEKGKPFPAPKTSLDASFSGRVTTRIPSFLHQELHYAAEENNTSLNQYIVSILAKHKEITSPEYAMAANLIGVIKKFTFGFDAISLFKPISQKTEMVYTTFTMQDSKQVIELASPERDACYV